jgi:RHS repeat-associated protein
MAVLLSALVLSVGLGSVTATPRALPTISAPTAPPSLAESVAAPAPTSAAFSVDPHLAVPYFGARYFSGAQGRFTGVGPEFKWEATITSPRKWNRYVYVQNNPLARIDPDGRDDYAIFRMDERLGLGPQPQSWGDMTPQQRGLLLGTVGPLAALTGVGGAGIAAQVGPGLLATATVFAASPEGQRLAAGVAESVSGAAPGSMSVIPLGTASLGRWGEARLAQVLQGAGEKPAGAFVTSLGKRFIDRLVDGIAHESKAGYNVKLTSELEKQVLKDVELVTTGQIRGVHWHFFNGVKQEVLDYLKQHDIQYTVHRR